MDQNICLLYLIRHGMTDNNEARPPRLQGRRSDPALSAHGCQQAARTAEWISSHLKIDGVYSSPLLRARQTAEPIAQRCRVPLQVVDELTEVDVGLWEGLSWDEIERLDPTAYKLFMEDASVNPYLGGENINQVQTRTIPVFTQLMLQNLGRQIVIVAHNVVNRAFLAHLLDLPLARYRSVPQDNCGINVIQFSKGRMKLITVNFTAHLQNSDNS